ncbi:hypothetical protein JI721_10615 [Alicyclobacillus cycloheptanicus]|uniref:Glyoxalase-like domain-containing protein n=1 Tax=Alicyclobacillus cycloheptanicus TaxID=1457 RepID=A0ABT9XGX5_9BACL|nr:hypothetical protein [Alicyclobacillus cycloheptanicus]MDQ0189063.1 hypothetical protein [Alicyclobacillus cycloheptanicus]WDM00199.1 hypothetical protein JI721_10615 [Alicyclobacillus cycloheptanicus]
MWVSVPVRDEEMKWIESIGGAWRLSKDGLYRQSQVELALVTESAWRQWQLPHPPAPIVTLDSVNRGNLSEVLQSGAEVAQSTQRRPWGAEVGFVRFPSGLLLEVTESIGGSKDVNK